MVAEIYKRRPMKTDDFADLMEYSPELFNESYRPSNYPETLEGKPTFNSGPRGDFYDFAQSCKPGQTKSNYEFAGDIQKDTDAEYMENTHVVEETTSDDDDKSTGKESIPLNLIPRK